MKCRRVKCESGICECELMGSQMKWDKPARLVNAGLGTADFVDFSVLSFEWCRPYLVGPTTHCRFCWRGVSSDE